MDTIYITIVNSYPQTDESRLQISTRAEIIFHRLGDMSRSRVSNTRDDESASGCVPERPRHGEHVRIVMDRSITTKNLVIRLRMDQMATAINRQNREGQHGANPYTQVQRGVPCSQESRETINPKDQIFLTHSLENQNHKQNNHCKQTKRNSFELAESHRLFTVVDREKGESQETGKTQKDMPSIVRRKPIKITGTDIDGNKLEFNVKMYFP